MPHHEAFRLGVPASNEIPRAGAIVIAVISAAILAGAASLAVALPDHRSLRSMIEPSLRHACKWLGIAIPIEVVSDDGAVIVPAAVPRTVVAGRILDADGRPVAGSAVRVRSDARPDWDWVTSTGSDGSFQVDGVVAGKVRVAAQDVDAGLVESPLLDATEARGVVLVLGRSVEVSGVVLDERGAPIARAAIKCAGREDAPGRVVIADEDGRFTVRVPARYIDRLTVWARGFVPATVSLGTASGAIQRDVRLLAARPVRGRVVDVLGNGVGGARVSACPGNDAEVATSDASGAFELPATVVGCWASAQHPRFAGARATLIGDRRDLVLRLGAGGAIEGTVVDEHGKPVGLFSVTIASVEMEQQSPGAARRTGETSDHLRGSFRLDDLAPGKYVLQVSAEGRADTQSRPIEVTRGKLIRSEQLVLTAAEGIDEASSGGEPTTGVDDSGEDGEHAGPAEAAQTTEPGSGE